MTAWINAHSNEELRRYALKESTARRLVHLPWFDANHILSRLQMHHHKVNHLLRLIGDEMEIVSPQ